MEDGQQYQLGGHQAGKQPGRREQRVLVYTSLTMNQQVVSRSRILVPWGVLGEVLPAGLGR